MNSVQAMGALGRAQDIRLARADLKRDMRSGAQNPARVIVDPPECILSMRIHDFLLAVPGIGAGKAARIVNRARVSGTRTIGQMTANQRLMVAAMLESRGVFGEADADSRPR